MPLITQDERAELQNAVGARQTVVAAGIARLYLASPDPKALRRNDPDSILRTFKNLSNEEWTLTNVVGALVLVIDRAADAFVFQIYDLQSYSLRFSYELYLDMTYEVLSAQFHAVEIEDCMAGFCFADAAEAKSFLSKVMALRPTSKNAGANLLKADKKRGFFGGFFGSSSRSIKERPDSIKIGAVRMVQHDQHVGVNADGTFDMDNLGTQWKQLFKQAGIKKKDLQDPETAAAIMATIAQQGRQQQVTELYQQAPEYEGLTEAEIEDAVEELPEEDLEAYARYEEELAKYYEDLAAYEAEQAALAAWEADNAALVEKQQAAREAEEAAALAAEEEEDQDDEDDEDDYGVEPRAGGASSASGGKTPPPLPPRKALKKADKELKAKEKEAKAQAKAAEAANKKAAEAVKSYRMSLVKVQKSPEQLEYERAAEEARAIAEEAQRAAEEAQRERDEIMKQIDEMRAKNAAARARISLPKPAARASRKISIRKSIIGSKKATPPPVPTSKPPTVPAVPPPPPPLPQMPPQPPSMPELPPLPRASGAASGGASKPDARRAEPKKPARPAGGLDADALRSGVSGAKLKKVTKVNDRSKPRVPKGPSSTLLRGIQKGGANLKHVSKAGRPVSKLPDLDQMKPKAQNQLMAKLIETMNQRRALVGDDDSEDEWSD